MKERERGSEGVCEKRGFKELRDCHVTVNG